MAIHWYPGHMHKAQKQITEVMPQIDLVIEVLDARIPYSSENPMVASLRKDKPCIKIFNKFDLADPEITARWQKAFEASDSIRTLPLIATETGQTQKLLSLCKELFPHREENGKPVRAMIMGIPNVGKSTLINALAGRTIAKVGNEPAVTKAQQRINLGNGIVLSDTPGILWPKVENPNSSYRLAATGAIKDTAMDYEDVAAFTAEYLLEAYPDLLKERYKIDELPHDEMGLLDEIARARGARRAGGRVDYHKVSEILLHEFRSGRLGLVSLETPEMAEKEEIEVQKEIARKEEEKAKRKAEKGKRKRPTRK